MCIVANSTLSCRWLTIFSLEVKECSRLQQIQTLVKEVFLLDQLIDVKSDPRGSFGFSAICRGQKCSNECSNAREKERNRTN